MRYWLYNSILFLQFTFGQAEAVWLDGIVRSELGNELYNINVTNLVTQQTVITNDQGKFRLPIHHNDALKFSAVGYEDHYVKMDELIVKNPKLVVKLKATVYSLDAVEIVKLDAQKMGIINYKPKKYTPAERRLHTAGRFSPWQVVLIPLGGMPLDPLINALSGRTAMLKKELEVERKEKALESLNRQLDSLYFTQQLHLPSDRVAAFQYYAVENPELRQLLKTENKVQLKFQLSQLLVEFLKPKQ